jgi:predicted permease
VHQPQRFRWLESILQDARYALRSLRHSPAFALTAVATLAVGIGVNAAVFTVANAVLFKGFRLVGGNGRILYIDTRDHGRGCCVSYPDFEDWRAQARSFEELGAVADQRITLSDGSGSPESYTASLVTANAFRLLGQSPLLGRDFAASDETPGAPAVAIFSHGFWERRYAKDPTILGRAIRINGAPATVIGVMPGGFSFPQNQDLWLPLAPTADRQQREARNLWFAFGRLAKGATAASARAELEIIGRRLATAHPRTNQNLRPALHRFDEFFIGPNATTIYGSLWGAVGFVLLIACANLANLLLARAVGRSREISLRIALGAGRCQIIRQLLVESVMLSAIGGVFGWWIAYAGVRAYELAANPPARAWAAGLLDFSMDDRVFLYVLAISIGTGILFGLAPALRLSKLDIHTALRDGGGGAAGGARGKRLSAALVAAEMALAVILLAGAGTLLRSFINIYTADPGFQSANILTAFLNLPDASYPGAEARIRFHQDLRTRLAASPAVESIAITDSLPASSARHLSYELAGALPPGRRNRPQLGALVVSPGYFRTLGVAVVSGREFEAADGVSGPPVALVNQRFANQNWPGEDPRGKRFRLLEGVTPQPWLTVVGVVPNIVHNDNTRQQFDPLIYLPYRQDPAPGMWVLVRTRVPPANLGTGFQREVHALDAELPIWLGPFTLADRLAATYWSRGLHGALFLVFAAIALLLASVGLYAVVAHSVSRHTREIGVRIALGATSRDILKHVGTQGIPPLAIGLTVGLAASFAVNRMLEAELVQVSPADPLTLAAASATLVVSAALGCLIPARRAMRIDPVIALRHE